MVRVSNNLLGILNFITFLLSIPILWTGIWLAKQGATECERFLDTPLIALGVFLMLISLAGLIGACFRITWLLWIYLVITFLLILILFCFTIFAFAVTNKGAGQNLSGKGYKEYRLGDYSNWLQKRVNSPKNWNKIQSCLQVSNVCKSLIIGSQTSADQYFRQHLSSVQSGCCKPSDECGFEYVSPTNWNRTGNSTIDGNPDCKVWRNDESFLCYGCESCKAGVLDNLKRDWKKVAVVNIVFIVFLIIVYSIGCCAFRENRKKKDNHYIPNGI